MLLPAEKQLPGFDVYFFKPLEGWTATFRVSLIVGITMAMPVFVWHVLGFVSPGLTRAEKRWVYPIVLGASAMFVLGCAFAYYIELPPALNFLLKPPRGEPVISISFYIDFVTRLMLVTGLVFEMPFVVMGLAKLGIVRSRQLLRWWRFAIVGAFILSAVVTPSIDPITQTLVAAPMVVLYFVGIGMARLVESAPLIPRA
jgi:sec-independent protein translocase protein TatC